MSEEYIDWKSRALAAEAETLNLKNLCAHHGICTSCGEYYSHHYIEPFATCNCNTSEWYELTEHMKLQNELRKLRGQMEVEWRPVVGFEGLYEVSSNGDIRNVQTGNIAAKSLMGDGYVKAALWKKGKRKQTSAHRVVAEAFIGGIDGLEINHRNGVKTDNRVSNLEITTRSGNVNHSYYELGHIIKPILATNIATGDTTEYRSIEEAVRIGGFRSSAIYACLNGKVKTHSGYSFSRPTVPIPVPAAPRKYHEFASAMLDAQPFITAETYGGRYIVAMRFERLDKMQDCHAALLALLQSAGENHDQ